MVERVARIALVPLPENEARGVVEDGVVHAVLPAPRGVLHRVDAEGVDAVLGELQQGRLQVAVHGRVFLVDVAEAEERVVLQLIAVVPIANVGVVMEVAARIVVAGRHERPGIVERPVLAGGVVVGVVRGEVDDHLDPGGVRARHQRVERRPGVAAVAEVLLDALEVAGGVAVVRRGRIAVAVRHIQVHVVERRRDPDGGDAHPLEVRHLLLDAGQVPSPVELPVRVRAVEEAGALGGVVVARVAVEEAVGDDLVDDLLLEILGGDGEREREGYRGEDKGPRELTERHVDLLLIAKKEDILF